AEAGTARAWLARLVELGTGAGPSLAAHWGRLERGMGVPALGLAAAGLAWLVARGPSGEKAGEPSGRAMGLVLAWLVLGPALLGTDGGAGLAGLGVAPAAGVAT